MWSCLIDSMLYLAGSNSYPRQMFPLDDLRDKRMLRRQGFQLDYLSLYFRYITYYLCWTAHLGYLCLSFHICKTGITVFIA